MSTESTTFNRRAILKTLTAGAVYSFAASGLAQSQTHTSLTASAIPMGMTTEAIATDESFWAKIATFDPSGST
ncbi:MAG: hypothetical protein ACI9LE_001764 [Paraglaciecola sp.]|jgi:hypothetical protein